MLAIGYRNRDVKVGMLTCFMNKFLSETLPKCLQSTTNFLVEQIAF